MNAELNLEPTQSLSPLVTVSLNYHRQAGDAAAVIAAAQLFAEDRKASEKLIESLFREKVEP